MLKIMLSETTTPIEKELALSELATLMLNLYTPMTREEWERNMAIYNQVLDRVGIGRDEKILSFKAH